MSRTYRITDQKSLRREFWQTFPDLKRAKVGGDFVADTRMTFVGWIDSLARGGQISEKLAQAATL